MAKFQRPTRASATPEVAGRIGPSATPATVGANAIKAVFHADYFKRLSVFNFLSVSYNGGSDYKFSNDVTGRPLLIEHEAELVGGTIVPKSNGNDASSADNSVFSMVVASGAPTQRIVADRYGRRQRIAVYDNRVKPNVDQYYGWITQSAPNRSENEKLKAEFERLKIQAWMDDALHMALKFSEAWVGFDSAAIPTDVKITQAEANKLDPANQGKPYIVLIDPRRVVDFTLDVDGRPTRVVIEEHEVKKATLADAESYTIHYREWTATTWTLYERLNTSNSLSGEIKIRRIDGGTHQFGKCPWYRFCPSFPVFELAELCRSLFNMTSLLDEECSQSTFTQKYITGVKGEEIVGANRGTGGILAIENDLAQVGAIGGVAGQADVLMKRCEQIADAIDDLLSIESAGSTSGAESGDKKMRDMQSLFARLRKISKETEDCENWLLESMKYIDLTNQKERTSYPQEFDVYTVDQLIARLTAVSKTPLVPIAFKKNLVLQILQKLEPYGSHEEYKAAILDLFDTDPTLVAALVDLNREGLATVDMVVAALGVPPKYVSDLIAEKAGHAEAQAMSQAAFGADPLNPDGSGDATSSSQLPQSQDSPTTNLDPKAKTPKPKVKKKLKTDTNPLSA